MNPETIGEAIRQRRLQLGLSAEELAAKLGINRATVYRYENSAISKLPSSVLEPLSRALQTTPQALLGWEEADIAPSPAPHTAHPLPIVGRVILNGVSPVFEAAQGVFYAAVSQPDHYICLRLDEDGMAPFIARGDLALIDCAAPVQSGDIVLALNEDQPGLVRKYQLCGETIVLQPFNPAFDALVFKKDEPLPLIVGKVIETRKSW